MPFQITVTKTYNTTNLFEDIKGLYKVAGVKGQPVAFIFTDNEVKEEGFLEYINQILMTGEVAGLFQKDELDAIVNDIRPIMKAESPGQSWTSQGCIQIQQQLTHHAQMTCASYVPHQLGDVIQKNPTCISWRDELKHATLLLALYSTLDAVSVLSAMPLLLQA